MDKTLIWLTVPGSLMIFAFLWMGAKYRPRSYDLEEYLLAGRSLSTHRFILATTTATLLGIMTLSHMGLFYRGGFSYGFLALAAIIVPLTSALFARRMWNLGRIFNPLTPAQLLGDYYRTNGIRVLTALVALLVALTLTLMSLRLAASLVEGLLSGSVGSTGSFFDALLGANSLFAPLVAGIMAGVLFFHTAYGGMGAILRIAAPVGIALVIALVLAALVSVDALGGFAAFFDHLAKLQQSPATAPLLAPGAVFDPLPAAAPTNMAWPGVMVASCLIAVAGLATTPATLMTSFTAAKGKSHAPAQFYAAAFLTGLVFLTTTIMIALLAHLAHETGGLPTDQLHPAKAGNEPQMIIQLLQATPLGTPLLMGFITLALLAGLTVSAAASLLTAGGMVANDIFYERLKSSNQPTYRKSIARSVIGAVLIVAFLISLHKPDDPLPLFLLAGAFGLQLLPAMAGLCYFKGLTGQAVQDGITAGLLAVIATSAIPQGLADLVGIPLPFDAWPLSLHPAFWGLLANIILLNITLIIQRATQARPAQKIALAHRRSFHVLPDGQPLMARNARFWRFIAVLIGVLFVLISGLPLLGETLLGASIAPYFPGFLPPLWSWQFLSWFVGLALVYVVAYKLQPTFDPEQAMHGTFNPQRRRFRVKAQTRQTEPRQTDIEKK